MAYGRCSNPKCDDDISPELAIQLCPSCRWIAKWAFAAGSGIVGGLLALWRSL